MKKKQPILLQGSWVALVTPFNRGRIDRPALKKLLDFHLQNDTDGLVISGTTGESATLSAEEKRELMSECTTHLQGRIPLMLGTGGNCTATATENTAHAADWGAQAVLVVTPYYNKPTQPGLIAHFTKVATATTLPVVLYNVPGRTGVNLLPSSVLALANVPNIRAVKEASGNLEQAMEILRFAPRDFVLFSGEDALNLPLMAVGARGTISVTANVAPRAMKEFNDAALAKNWDKAREIHFSLLDLHRHLFLESNPIPVKTALAHMGLIKEEFRLPLVKAADATREKLVSLLQRLKLKGR
ncbi:MAG TPA: 4-hydroxy-tetrahydrodipicolinate synthase [Candidatus Ozemobacteraceae bacterium]|nr:4-hydroxy-tetrahydrodipicolinate synthase [Candidatus Ozemobacteraceae bacterium]